MNATQRREINSEKQTGKSNLHRWFGTPLWVTAQSWQRRLEFQEVTTAFSDQVQELQKRVQRRIERLFGQPFPKRRRRRLNQVLGIEQLEARMLLSASAIGPEFLVNTTTSDAQQTSNQSSQAVAMDANGNFVVTWSSLNQDGDNQGVYAQRYNAAGVAQGNEFLVNATTTGSQQYSSVAMASNGDFVIVWNGEGSGDADGVFGQRYNAAGVAQGSEFLVNTTTTDRQRFASVAMDNSGNFVVTWDSKSQDSGVTWGVYGQRFDAAGVAQGGEFLVNTTTGGAQKNSSVAMDASGNFVVTWQGGGSGDSQGIFGQQYDASGVAQGTEFLINTTTTQDQLNPSVAMNASGDFVVTWDGKGPGDNSGVFGQRYNAAGVAQGGEFLVNTTTGGSQEYSSVKIDATGAFVIVWSGNGSGDNNGVWGQEYDANGVAQGGQFLINSTTGSDQQYPSLAMDDDGDFVVIWSGNGIGDADGVFGQRYTAAGTNQTPVAVADGYSVNEDNTLNIAAAGVLANDSDGDGDALSAVLVSGPSNGSVTLNADGSFSYTPDADFNGTDSFTYQANDGIADSNVVTVAITVNPVNDTPTATNDGYSVDEGNMLNIVSSGVLANDADVDGDALTAILIAGPDNGTLTFNADGIVRLHAGCRVQRLRQLHLYGYRDDYGQRGQRYSHGG